MELKRAAISLATLLAAYLFYASVVVPFIEPPAPRRVQTTGRVGEASPSATDRYQADLEGLFAADAWENESPKILRSRNILLLFKDYQPQEDGTLRVFPCTAVVIGDRATDTDRRASSLILQAPEGAVLQLDRPAGQPGTQFGQPVGGFLLGKIHIYSHGQSDGTGRLNMRTSDVQISPEMILTPHEVELEYERSHARGRDLMIKLLPLKNNRSVDHTQGWAGIRSIELIHLEHMHLEIQERTTTDDNRPAESTPVDIVCQGPLRVDFVDNLVTLEEQVELRRRTPEAMIDLLQCQKLSLHLRQPPDTRQDEPGDPASTPPSSEKTASRARPARDQNQFSSLPKLEVGKVVAEGNPVILDAPSRGAYVRSRKLLYDLELGRFQLWAEPDSLNDHVLLRSGRQQLMAREFNCWLDSPRGVKQARAIGPGRFLGELDGADPQSVQVDWLAELVFVQEGELHHLTLDRGASAKLSDRDGIEGDVIHLWLEPAPRPLVANRDPHGPEAPMLEMRPQRVVAMSAAGQIESRRVRLWSEGIEARTERLDASFQHLPSGPSDAAPLAAVDHGPGGPPRTDATIRPASLRSRANTSEAQEAPARETRVSGQTINATLRVRGSDVTVGDLVLQDKVRIEQFSLDNPTQSLFDLRADAMRMQDPSERQMHRLTAVGQPVEIQSEQMRLRTAELHLDQAQNIVWTNQRGTMSMPIDRDANGRPLPAPQEMTIDWFGKMAFDGARAHFAGGVDVRSAEQRMRGETLDVQLTRKLTFGQSSPGEPPEIRQVDVNGNVLIELAEYKQQQLTSIARLQVPFARIDRQTGDLLASGPGRLTSVRTGFRGDLNPTGGAPPTTAEPLSADAKTFLQVDYQREITGNLFRNIVSFADRVQVVYGPVLSWNETLTTQGPLRQNDVLLSCDQLTVAQSPLASPTAASDQRMLDLLAQGNTYVEGQTFTARGDRVSYTQSKELLVLEGAGRTNAVLSHQTRVGAPRSETTAGKIFYWIRTRRAEVADGDHLDLSDLGR